MLAMTTSGHHGNGHDPAQQGGADGQSVLQNMRLSLEAELAGRPSPARHRAAQLELCQVLLELREEGEASTQARQLLERSIGERDAETAAAACLAMYESGQEEAVAALGHGLWLVIACPVAAEQILRAMRSLIAETPADSDGAAVAAMLGYFLIDTRAAGAERERQIFLARQLVAEVAERHRGITSDEEIAIWVSMHELDDVDMLLQRMKTVIEAIVPQWWFDREAFLEQVAGDG